MKSNRERALSNKSSIKPGRIDFDRDAIKVLKNLERARNYGNKRKYNAELKKLANNHPEFEASILAMVWR